MLQLKSISIPFIAVAPSDVWQQELALHKGDVVHIKATSGKGKSSLVQTIYGLNNSFNGDIFFHGKSYKSISIEDWCNLRSKTMSIVFQDLKLFEENTAWENIDVKRAQSNLYAAEKINEFAKALNVSHTLDRKIKTLSYGERQRVAIIRALMQPFDLLLLDEPFSHLDRDNILLACELISQEVSQRNATMLLVDLEEDTHFNYTQKLLL
jgi:ABC-type lipoprotein export system ATPase subunit